MSDKRLPSQSAKRGIVSGSNANTRNRLNRGSQKLAKVNKNLKQHNQQNMGKLIVPPFSK